METKKTNINWPDYNRIGINSIQQYVGSRKVFESPLDNEDIKAAGISKLKSGYDISRSNFFCHVVFFTISGSGCIETPFSKKIIDANKLMLVPAGNPARYFIKSKEWNMIWFDLENTKRWSWLKKEKVQVRDAGEDFKPLYNAMKNLYREIHNPNPNAKQLAEFISKEISIYLNRELKINSFTPEDLILEQLRNLFRDIDTKIQLPWSVDMLAKNLSISTSHLYHLCQKHLKTSPMGYVKQLRIEQAKKLLIQTYAPISDISYSVGYENPLNFSTAFRKKEGLSPKKFREKYYQ